MPAIPIKTYRFANYPNGNKELNKFLCEGIIAKPIMTDVTRQCRRYMRKHRMLQLLETLHALEQGLSKGEWLGAMELFDNGFNVFVNVGNSKYPDRVHSYREEE